MQPVGIIGAMDSELQLLLNKLENAAQVQVGSTVYHTGELASVPVVIARCGIGKVCAAMCAQAMIDRFSVRCIINTGVAGGLKSGLSVGDMVLCTYAVQHDFDVTAFGHVRGYMCTGEDHTQPTRYWADAHLREVVATVAAETLTDRRAVKGVIASGDVFVADAALKQQLTAEFDAMAAEMEGAAVAQTATANGVPFLVIRALSDLADGSASVSFDTFEAQAAAASAQLLMAALPRL